MLVDEFIEIKVTHINYKMLMDRGYEMPDEYKFINSKGNISLKFGFKILIYYFDLPESSRTKVRVKCDYPGCTDIHEVEYCGYIKRNHDSITYCSKHAHTVFLSGKKRQSCNPNKEHDDIRKTPEYAITKLNVHERDKYTCVSCGKKIYDPVFHHLYSVNTHKELACKIDNGVTLCKKCHKNFHNIYGYGNNTPMQFIDFIKRELDWLEDYDKTKVEKKLVYCAELDEISTKSYFSKKLDIPSSGISSTINPNTRNKSIKGYHFISIQEKEKMKPEEFEKWKKNSLIEHENYSEIPKNERLVWHKESGEIKKAEDFLNTFEIKELRYIYNVCDRKQHSICNQHFMWIEDYNEAIKDPKKMKEWEEWFNSFKFKRRKKTQQLIWHKETNQFYTAEQLVDKFGIKNIYKVYLTCNRKQKHAYNNHYLWAKDYEKMTQEQIKEWENWITEKNERLIWHKETNQFYTTEELVDKFGIKNIYKVYSVCDRKQKSVYNNHYLWAEDYKKMTQEQMKEWENLITEKNERLIWHKETNQFYTAEELVDKFRIKNIYCVYSACDRKQKHAYNNHFLWAEDYKKMTQEQMKEWENWITEKNERLVWHKESGEIKKAEDFLNTFGIKKLKYIYNVCDRKQHSIRNQHFMWIEDYNEAIKDPKKMREWEEWILDKSKRLVWHKESGEIKKAEDFLNTFGIKKLSGVYAVCNRKLCSMYGQHFMWIEDYNEAIEDPKKMKEWEEWALNKNGVKIVCITENTIFNSIAQAAKYYNASNISKSCRYNDSRSKNDNLKSAGKYKGRKLIWMYEKKFIQEYGIEAYNNLIQIK